MLNTAHVEWLYGNLAEAFRITEEAVAALRDFGDLITVAEGSTNMALLLHDMGQHEAAAEFHRAAIVDAERLGEDHKLAIHLAQCLARLGEPAQAMELTDRALGLMRL